MDARLGAALDRATRAPLSAEDAWRLGRATGEDALRGLKCAAAARRDAHWGRRLTYSPKVFLPLTNLCRNHCDYCTFRRSAGQAVRPRVR